MAIQSGTHLGPYEIVSAIGAGGMGEVYRARDPKLGRDVAIKVLPAAFAGDAARMARFQREAKVHASLDHPNIASIYGLEDSGGTRALVMQLVEGPTLADRIKQGPIPVDEAVHIARQIADALEYAHERGIIHRDLKPANVKVSADDTVKVLDFGLAKALEGDPASIDISTSPTVSRMATQRGVLLGTAAYMSPEQAKAKPVDRRADIWAFGCVLYEMLTGKRAFCGETVTDTLAAVIKEEPDWSQLPAATPMRVRVLLQRCLQKDPKQRLRDIGDARISLDEVLTGAPEGMLLPGAAVPTWRRALTWGLGLIAVAITGIAVWILKPEPPPRPTMRYEIPLPEKVLLTGSLAVSPDGRRLAFIGTGQADGQSRVWLRSLETLEVRPLDGTEGAAFFPFWSPDSRYIAFASQRKLKKIDVSGSHVVTICDAPSYLGGSWNRDDQIVFGSGAGMLQVSASGGSPTPITTDALTAAAPSFLPDGHHFVYWGAPFQGGGSIYLGLMGSKPKDRLSRKLLSEDSMPVFAQSLDATVGYLLFVRGSRLNAGSGTLMAQAFDNRHLELIGDAVPIAEQVSNLHFSASATDTVVYVEASQNAAVAGGVGSIQGQLAWFDRDGKVLGSFGESGLYRSLALSPDGKRVAFERADPKDATSRNIWLYEFGRGVTTRFTLDSAWDGNPVWSPDGSRIAFGSNRGGNIELYQKASNLSGEDELLVKSAGDNLPNSWSPDGRFLLFTKVGSPYRLWLLPVGSGSERKFVPLDHSEFDEYIGRFSPDGRWIAYQSNESGRFEIYVRPFSELLAMGAAAPNGALAGEKWQVSKDGGTNPLWRRDGNELFYLSSLGGTAMAVEVNTRPGFKAGIPKTLFKVPPGVVFWDVSPDGKRFLMAAALAESPNVPKFTVVLNWPSLLKK